MANQNNKKYIRLGLTFLGIGIVGLSVPFLTLGFLQGEALEDDAARIEIQLNDAFVKADETIPSETPRPTINPERPNIKNRLLIGKAGIDMALFEGNINVLDKGGWIYPNTSTPDQGNNTVIFGHRFRYLPPIKNTFFNIDKAGIGDEIKIRWQDKEYTYRISETKIIEPTDLSVLAKSDKPIITLITCYPLFSTKQRLVVTAELQ